MLPWSKCSKQTASMKQTTGRTEPRSTEHCSKQLRRQCPSCTPSFKLKMPCLHSGADCDRQETKISKLPPIPEVVWQQPTGIVTNRDNLNKTTNESTIRTNVASQTSPPKGTQPQNHVDTTEQSSVNQTGNEPVLFLDCSKKSPMISKIQNSM